MYAEDLFEWVWNSIDGCGGDGGAAVVCDNPHETAKAFAGWAKKTYDCDVTKNSFPNAKDTDPFTEYPDMVRFDWWNCQENLGFHKRYEDNIAFPGENVFIVEKDCKFGYEKSNFVIKGLCNENQYL